MNHNAFASLRAAFPSQGDRIAIELLNAAGVPLRYSWRDLERATAMLAHLLGGLSLAPASSVAFQVEPSVEAVALCLAVLRAGHVAMPLSMSLPNDVLAEVMAASRPAVVVCDPKRFGEVSKLAFLSGSRAVYTLSDTRSGSLIDRAAHCADDHEPVVRDVSDPAAVVYQAGAAASFALRALSHGELLAELAGLHEAWAGDNWVVRQLAKL